MEFTATLIKQRRTRSPRENDVDILDIWIAKQTTNPNFTDEMIAAQAFVFFELAYREIQEHMTGPSNVIYEQYGRIKLFEALHSLETLQLYPSDYALDRVPLLAVLRDPNLFPDPNVFYAQRLLLDVTCDANKQLEEFVGFGTGPRNCVGKRLALFFISVDFCSILTRIRLFPAVQVAEPFFNYAPLANDCFLNIYHNPLPNGEKTP
ncbi:cytochrome P450 3A24-like [Tropilaelaps mercedesae]|uniref:Cytochrome P450 3A24-like n=1 Tax=Tropilaelaps mercedesae TaxID=418985 RepID=A0A1V9X970_9ACAR|nr:cytochrome P450 3A24-like [Tropilaelaps mercedesae]